MMSLPLYFNLRNVSISITLNRVFTVTVSIILSLF